MKRQRYFRYSLFVFFVGLVAMASAVAAIPRSIPEEYVKFWVKDIPYQSSITELFKLTKFKVQFTKDVKVEQTVSIDVQHVRWNVLLNAVLDSYNMGYRFVADDTVEIYKK